MLGLVTDSYIRRLIMYTDENGGGSSIDTMNEDQRWIVTVAYSSIHALAAGFLIATAIVAVVVKPNLSGALAFSVNMIAAIAYGLLALNRFYPRRDTWKTRLQRTVVRSIDWLCTFPLLQLEVLNILGVSTQLHGGYYAAIFSLAFFTILLDTILRLAYIHPVAAPCTWWSVQAVGTASFILMLSLIFTVERTIPPGNGSDIPFVFVWFWVIYPLVAFSGDMLRWFSQYDPEFAEDVLFTCLDVFSKAGLAAYIAYLEN